GLRPDRPDHQTKENASAVSAHHPLARQGEQHLLDQFGHMVVRRRVRRTSSAVHVIREVDLDRHVTSTRGCALTGSSGVPVGTQVEEPVIDATGTPPASTLVAPTSHWPVAHGGLPVPVRAQPAIAYGEESVTAG